MYTSFLDYTLPTFSYIGIPSQFWKKNREVYILSWLPIIIALNKIFNRSFGVYFK